MVGVTFFFNFYSTYCRDSIMIFAIVKTVYDWYWPSIKPAHSRVLVSLKEIKHMLMT